MSVNKRTVILIAVGIGLLCGAVAADAEIYKWVDEQGQMHFQDHPPQGVGKVADLEVRDSSPSLPREIAPVPPPVAVRPGRAAAPGVATPPRTTPRNAQVELYTVDWCPWCKKAREFFRSRGVPFSDYNVDKDPAAAARRKALDPVKGVPYAIVNGVKINGYSAEAYTRALDSPAPASP